MLNRQLKLIIIIGKKNSHTKSIDKTQSVLDTQKKCYSNSKNVSFSFRHFFTLIHILYVITNFHFSKTKTVARKAHFI